MGQTLAFGGFFPDRYGDFDWKAKDNRGFSDECDIKCDTQVRTGLELSVQFLPAIDELHLILLTHTLETLCPSMLRILTIGKESKFVIYHHL